MTWQWGSWLRVEISQHITRENRHDTISHPQFHLSKDHSRYICMASAIRFVWRIMPSSGNDYRHLLGLNGYTHEGISHVSVPGATEGIYSSTVITGLFKWIHWDYLGVIVRLLLASLISLCLLSMPNLTIPPFLAISVASWSTKERSGWSCARKDAAYRPRFLAVPQENEWHWICN